MKKLSLWAIIVLLNGVIVGTASASQKCTEPFSYNSKELHFSDSELPTEMSFTTKELRNGYYPHVEIKHDSEGYAWIKLYNVAGPYLRQGGRSGHTTDWMSAEVRKICGGVAYVTGEFTSDSGAIIYTRDPLYEVHVEWTSPDEPWATIISGFALQEGSRLHLVEKNID